MKKVNKQTSKVLLYTANKPKKNDQEESILNALSVETLERTKKNVLGVNEFKESDVKIIIKTR